MAQSQPTKTRTPKPGPKPAQERANTPAAKRPVRARHGRNPAGDGERAKPLLQTATASAPAERAKAKLNASAQTDARVKGAESSPSAADNARERASKGAADSKQARVIAMLRRSEGATIAELTAVTGWLSHSVRGAISGVLKRKLGLVVDNRVEPGRGRVYRTGNGPKSAPMAPTPTAPAKGRTPRASAAAIPGEAG